MTEAQKNLIDTLRSAVRVKPDVWGLRHELAEALSSAQRFDEALELFSQLAAERPDDNTIQRELVAVYEAVRLAEVETPSDAALAPTSADRAFAYLADARACHTLGDFAGAEAKYRAALDLQPDLISALQNLSLLLLESRRSTEAIPIARRILSIGPNANAHFILGGAQANLGMTDAAIESYRQAVATDPGMAPAYIQLGIILRKLGLQSDAIRHFEQAITARPNDAVAHIELGAALEQRGEKARALTHFVRARELQPLRIVPACNAKADFSALLLWSPGRANTPMQYLLEQAPFECRFVTLVADTACGTAVIDESCDVVVNLISDVDQTRDFLPVVARLVEGLGKPVINHPTAILATGRQSITYMLAEIPDTRIPRVTTHKPGDLHASSIDSTLSGHTLPLLLRVAGTHGGDDFERVASAAEIGLFVAQHPADGYYVAEYVDYQSADGYFRKYRVIFVNGEIIPYHLAIGDHWKVHHFRTTMKDNPWMQREEEAFLAAPERVFSPKHFAALLKIQATFGLDFFGIDCAIDRDGKLLVFEVNASMLVQPDDSKFPYKIPRNVQVKTAFHAMLAQAAARGHVN